MPYLQSHTNFLDMIHIFCKQKKKKSIESPTRRRGSTDKSPPRRNSMKHFTAATSRFENQQNISNHRRELHNKIHLKKYQRRRGLLINGMFSLAIGVVGLLCEVSSIVVESVRDWAQISRSPTHFHVIFHAQTETLNNFTTLFVGCLKRQENCLHFVLQT